MHRITLTILLLTLAAAAPRRPEIVTTLSREPLQLRAGDKAIYPLTLTILKGFHIQANPASEQFLIPTTVNLEAAEGITPQPPAYPKGVAFKLNGSEKELTTYENDITVEIPIQSDDSASPGDRTLKGTVRYQGCDRTTCFPPVTMPFEVKVLLTK